MQRLIQFLLLALFLCAPTYLPAYTGPNPNPTPQNVISPPPPPPTPPVEYIEGPPGPGGQKTKIALPPKGSITDFSAIDRPSLITQGVAIVFMSLFPFLVMILSS